MQHHSRECWEPEIFGNGFLLSEEWSLDFQVNVLTFEFEG